jgi:hypothetical protein
MKKLLLALAGAALSITGAWAGLVTQSGGRCYNCTAAGGGEWADVYVDMSASGPELATNGRVVGIDGTDVNAWDPNISAGNGCSITFESAGAYDGENSVKLVPPDTGVQPAYCGIIGGNLTNSGANDIAQVNIRFVVVVGPRYIDLASSAKWLCVGVSTTAAGSRLNRACSFDNYEPDVSLAGGRIWSVTSDETQSWHEPEIIGCYFWDCGTDDEKGFIVRSTAAHSGTPAVGGPNEPLYFELELDVRQNRGNANGRNRLYIRTRDGLIVRTMDIPLTWEGSWSFTWDQIIEIEGLGWYFNTPGTAHADNWIRFSHVAISANRSVGDPIGPPPGFNTGFLLVLAVVVRRRKIR